MGLRKTVVLFALPEERKPFPAPKRWQSLDNFSYWGIIETVCSGVGSKNAASTADDCLNVSDILLVCGFAGGLSGTMEPGNLILAEKVTDGEDSFLPDFRLLKTAQSACVPKVNTQTGTLVTVNKVATTPTEKRELAARTGAIAVDMETAGAVRVAQERGIPWLAVRAITDGVNDELPLDFNALANPDGSVNRGRVIRATLAQPHKIPALIRLGQRSSLAANNLAAFLVAFLQTLPENQI